MEQACVDTHPPTSSQVITTSFLPFESASASSGGRLQESGDCVKEPVQEPSVCQHLQGRMEQPPDLWGQMGSLFLGLPRLGRSRLPERWPNSKLRLKRLLVSCTRTWRMFWRETGSLEIWKRGLMLSKMVVLSLRSRQLL